MKKDFTELVFILDRSGSMAGLESDTVGGFNSLIDKQKRQSGTCCVSTVLFNNTSAVLHDRVPLDKIEPMTVQEYAVGGCTALLDAVGGAIRHISNVHKYAREEDVPEQTLFVITTDGLENASRAYSAEQVKALIRQKKAEYGWEFLFLGANIDAVEAAGRIGISEDRAVTYHADGAGTQLNYAVVSDAVCHFRACRAVDTSWKKKIEKDYKGRK